MTPPVFGLTERAIAAIGLPETSWIRRERLHRRAKQAPLTNGIGSVAKYEQEQCKVVHNNQRRF
jgi:hypothetical protein